MQEREAIISWQQLLEDINSAPMGQQKVVVKILAMNDEKTKQKAMEAVADVHGVDSIAANTKEQKMIIMGEMDTIKIATKLKKIGKIDILSVGPAIDDKMKSEEN